MTYRRKNSIRLSGYDYHCDGYYFFTIVVQDRRPLFGNISNGKMQVNPAGAMVWECWKRLAFFNDNVNLDHFVVMPDHIHGIICIRHNFGRPLGAAPANGKDVAQIIGELKAISTKQYCFGVSKFHWTRFRDRLWQRNFHDYHIRNKHQLNAIRRYIRLNPYAAWKKSRIFL